MQFIVIAESCITSCICMQRFQHFSRLQISLKNGCYSGIGYCTSIDGGYCAFFQETDPKFAEFRQLFSKARAVLVLTGAGISAESGVPTFRGAGGFWRQFQATVRVTLPSRVTVSGSAF